MTKMEQVVHMPSKRMPLMVDNDKEEGVPKRNLLEKDGKPWWSKHHERRSETPKNRLEPESFGGCNEGVKCMTGTARVVKKLYIGFLSFPCSTLLSCFFLYNREMSLHRE